MDLLLLAVMAGPLAAGQPEACPAAAACFERLEDRQHLVLLEAGLGITPGTYSWSSGLEGEDLLLFDDYTFLYLEWSDSAGPTVYDKGPWRIRSGVLELRRDADVTWAPNEHRRYIAVRHWNVRNEVLLAGVDVEGRSSWGHLKRQAGWKPGESATAKHRLLRDAWRPSFYRWSK